MANPAIKVPSASGKYDVGTQKVQWNNRATDITLTASDLFKTHRILATTEISVTLPNATTVPGGAQADVLGIVNLGMPINIRYNDGSLFMSLRGRGMEKTNIPSMYNPGVKLDLIDASTSNGTWYPAAKGGTMNAARLVTHSAVETNASVPQYDVWIDVQYSSYHTNSPGVVPRMRWSAPSYNQSCEISDTVAIQFLNDQVNGTRVRLITVNSSGVPSAGAISTLTSYVSPDYGCPAICVLGQNVSGYDYVAICYRSAAAVWSVRILEIVTGTTTINAMSAATAFPSTSAAGKTLAQQPYNSSRAYMSLCGISSTVCLCIYSVSNTTDANYNDNVFSITRGGSVGSPTVTLGTSTRIGTNVTQNAVMFSVLVGNVSNRVYVAGYAFNASGQWGGDASTRYHGVVLDVSTPTTPTLAYRIPLDSVTGLQAGARHWYDDTTNEILVAYSPNTSRGDNNNHITFAAFLIGASAIGAQRIYGMFGTRLGVDGNNGNGDAFNAYSSNTAAIPLTLTGSLAKGWKTFTGYVTHNYGTDSRQHTYGYFKHAPLIGGESSAQKEHPIGTTSQSSTTYQDEHSYVAYFDASRITVTGFFTNMTGNNMAIPLRSGRFILSFLTTGTASVMSTIGGRTAKDCILITLELPDVY